MDSVPTSALGSAILQRLQRTPMSGYELKKRFASSVGFGWRAYDTQIYRELKALESAGLITGRADRGGRGPERRIFALTDSGYEALIAWLESPLEEPWHKSELNIRIWSMDLIPPDRLEELLMGVEESTQEYLDQLTARRKELRERFGRPEIASEPQGVGHQLILEFDVQMAQLKLAWIDRVRAVAQIRSLAEPSTARKRKRRAAW
jgi:PadR family transcriptional regulator, regulatory protein AphA